jgi:ABC-type bacteriocin/lantibiotic exporter with double-glycine peptidase domain
MVARYHGIATSVGAVANLANVDPDYGALTGDLVFAALVLGLGARETNVESPITELERALGEANPVIVAVDAGWLYNAPVEAPHYVVVVTCGENEVTLHDPDVGPEIRVPRTRFLAAWTACDFAGVLTWTR